MPPSELLLCLVDVPGGTLNARVILTLQRAILEGRLPPGALLPGSRVLGEMLNVARQTVISALKDLEAEGWVVSVPNRGTYVARELPSGAPRPVDGADLGQATQVGFDVPSFLRSISTTASGAILLADGAPDPRLAPAEELAKAYQRGLRRHGATLLQGRDPLGTGFLRETLAAWISERHGTQVAAERILVTRGSRGALTLLATALFRPGEVVAVESPGNRGAWAVFQKRAGLSLRSVPVDAGGVDPEALEELFKREQVRMLYLTPRRQFPTTVTLARERRARVLQLAAAHRVAVLEDDYDGEYTFEGQRPEPLLALGNTGQTLHMGSISRLLAPGLRMGYLVLPAPLVPFLGRFKSNLEEPGDPVLEWAVADLIRDGELARHLRRVRKTYLERRDFLVASLRERLGAFLDLEAPQGGMGLWIKVKAPVDAEAWIQAARACGLTLNPPSHFYLEGAEPAFRMGFAQANEAELSEAVQRLEKALASVRKAR